MQAVLDIASALSDPARVRVLAALQHGELCLCHLVALLELAPSTVSRHMDLLVRAGLVARRKQGRWAYFRLAEREAAPPVRSALRWVQTAVADDPAVAADARRLAKLCCRDLSELTACYREKPH